jgi:guanosine-3',5'-bis(diphosphate) 3'-pyrophosphohydrolase
MGPQSYESGYQHLEDILTPHISREELQTVQRAFDVAKEAHTGQMRDEGTPYIVHPLRVAIILSEELELYLPSLSCGALLHDVIEDTGTTRDQVADWFGEEVATIVWLLTKLEGVSLPEYLAAIEAAAGTGAATVKLCDRLDNLRSITHSPKAEKKRRYIRTTERYYLPMAARISPYIYDQLCVSLNQARDHVRSLEPD